MRLFYFRKIAEWWGKYGELFWEYALPWMNMDFKSHITLFTCLLPTMSVMLSGWINENPFLCISELCAVHLCWVSLCPFSLKVFLPSDGTTNGKEMPGGFQPVPAISLHHLACLSDRWLCWLSLALLCHLAMGWGPTEAVASYTDVLVSHRLLHGFALKVSFWWLDVLVLCICLVWLTSQWCLLWSFNLPFQLHLSQ